MLLRVSLILCVDTPLSGAVLSLLMHCFAAFQESCPSKAFILHAPSCSLVSRSHSYSADAFPYAIDPAYVGKVQDAFFLSCLQVFHSIAVRF